jgi:hypothetical protein
MNKYEKAGKKQHSSQLATGQLIETGGYEKQSSNKLIAFGNTVPAIFFEGFKQHLTGIFHESSGNMCIITDKMFGRTRIFFRV